MYAINPWAGHNRYYGEEDDEFEDYDDNDSNGDDGDDDDDAAADYTNLQHYLSQALSAPLEKVLPRALYRGGKDC